MEEVQQQMSAQNPAQPQQGLLDRLFKLSEHKTTIKAELIAGLTTFITMVHKELLALK